MFRFARRFTQCLGNEPRSIVNAADVNGPPHVVSAAIACHPSLMFRLADIVSAAESMAEEVRRVGINAFIVPEMAGGVWISERIVNKALGIAVRATAERPYEFLRFDVLGGRV